MRRLNSSSEDGLEYFNPFPSLLGSDLLLLYVIYKAHDPDAKFHSHFGEEFVYILKGEVTVQLYVPATHSRRMVCKAITLSAAQKDKRSLWFRSEIPHRVLRPADGTAPELLVFYAVRQGPRAIAGMSSQDANHPQPLSKDAQSAKRGSAEDGLKAQDLKSPFDTRIVEIPRPGADERKTWPYFTGIGPRLERLRYARGFSVAHLAALAQIPASHLTRIEDGQLTPKVATLLALSEALNVPIAALLPDDPPRYVRGCFTYDVDNPGTQMQPKAAEVLWRPYRLRARLAGNPWAKSLLPLILYFSESINDCPVDWASEDCKVAIDNARTIQSKDYISYGGVMMVHVLEGAIDVVVLPRIDSHLNQGTKDPSPRNLQTGHTLYLRCEHGHRFALPSKVDTPTASERRFCKLLAVVMQDGVSRSIHWSGRQTPSVFI
ncbi:MAG: helix-turn-helix domain-containing protein [Planctomycetia bacterium]|nr:helix-turn-helix domain-containing protein [Planctomycetia bacterium]